MKKIWKVIIVVIILLVVACGLYLSFNKDDDNIITEIFTSEKEKEDKDNENGIYVYEEKIGNSIKASSSCTISSFKYYVVILNDVYYYYKDSCLGIYQLDIGETKDLKIEFDEIEKVHNLIYEGNKYVKNNNKKSIVPNDTFVNNESHNLYLDSYKFLLKETMIDKHYYTLNRKAVGLTNITFNIEYDQYNDIYNLKIESFKEIDDNPFSYTYSAKKIDDLPNFYNLNNRLVIIEKYELNGRVNYDLKLFTMKDAIVYQLRDVFPIIVNGIHLSPDTHYIYVTYDYSAKRYVLLVSEKQDFCVKDSESNNVAYYEFALEVDYKTFEFKTPKYIRAWYEKDGCNHYYGLKEE